jgi:hypothetical protein
MHKYFELKPRHSYLDDSMKAMLIEELYKG